MNTIISLLADPSLKPFPTSRPLALTPVAGSTILGHMLQLLLEDVAELASAETPITFLVPERGEADVADYLADHLPDANATLVPVSAESDTFSALRMQPSLLGSAPLLLIDGLPIVDADFTKLISAEGDAAVVVKDATPVDVAWFRSGTLLAEQLSAQQDGISAVVDALTAAGSRVTQVPATLLFTIRDAADLLHANQHLLGQGYGAQDDIIERSYAEDFTVISPVFIHPEAEIDNCVLGPYVSIGADASLRDCIVSNSIIDEGCDLALAILDGSLLGREVVVNDKSHTIRVADGSLIDLSDT